MGCQCEFRALCVWVRWILRLPFEDAMPCVIWMATDHVSLPGVRATICICHVVLPGTKKNVARGRSRTCAPAGTRHAMHRCITQATVYLPSKKHERIRVFSCVC